MEINVIITVVGELWGAVICALSFFMILLHKDNSYKDNSVRRMLLICTLLLISDSIAWGLDGRQGELNRVLLLIGNYLVYTCNYFLMALFGEYMWNMVKKDGEKVPHPFALFWGVIAVSFLIHTVGQFFGWYYTIDQTNIYHRGPIFWLANVSGVVGAITLAWAGIHYRDRLSGYSKIAAVSYCVLPSLATIIQVAVYGYPMQVISLAMATFITYFVREQEVRTRLEKKIEEDDQHKQELLKMNDLLNTRMEIIQSVIKTYYAAYYIDLTENSYIELSTNDSGRARYAKRGEPQSALYDMSEFLILPEFTEGMAEFVNLSTLSERMKDKDVIFFPFIGVTAGWSAAYFIAGERNDNGTLKSAIWASRMIHDEKRLEEENRKKIEDAMKKAEASSAAKTVFLNNMSHDLRTPMNAILGFSKLMENELDDKQALGMHLKYIQESGDYLLSIINNVLDMSRIESGNIELKLDTMDVGNSDSGVIDLFSSEIEKKKLVFTHGINVKHRHVLADETRMTQILVNLLGNAIKYTPDGGKIHLQTNEVPCSRDGYATYVVKVSDTGIGMSEEFQKHIFESFTREHTTTESKVIGTGLGMAIVKKLVELMGGTIEVESEIGKGTTFTVTISLKIIDSPDAYLDAQMAADNEDVDISGKRILIAEDNDLNAEIAMALLENVGVNAERAADGVECVNMLINAEAGYYDIILMDIQMPNMNGYEATEKIRSLEDKNKADIPIVAVTANAFDEDRKHSVEVGMNGHLAKPIEMQKLLAVINNYCK